MTSPTHLDALTGEGALYERLPDNAVRCVACGHRCLIRDGRRGICKVRYNDGGTLRVPRNYVAALQCDPVEKKPFFHVLPGTNAVTFGMLGCDFHCGYCIVGEVRCITNRGPLPLRQLFESAERIDHHEDGDIGYPTELYTVTGSGAYRRIRAVFKHRYRGALVVLCPYYLPPLRCTPDHRVYATTDPAQNPVPTRACDLTRLHYLAIPRRYAAGIPQAVDVAAALRGHLVTYSTRWKLSDTERRRIVVETARGRSSREIGLAIGKSGSYVRHVRSKIARGHARDTRTTGPLLEGERVRFPNERRPGLPVSLPLDTELAALLGFYCAEGCVVRLRGRPNSYKLNISFGHAESARVERVCSLFKRCVGVRAHIVRRTTTTAVVVSKASVALLFKALAGGRSGTKRVPEVVARAPAPVARAFLDAYLDGDGYRTRDGQVTATTVSRKLAHGLGWLALRLGHLPSLYEQTNERTAVIQGRTVNRAPRQYIVQWYESNARRRRLRQSEDHFLVPLRGVFIDEYDGDVYNMEVETEHNYLAGFFLVSNCQNWLTSQALRDPRSTTQAIPMTAEEVVAYAKPYDGRLVVSSYNEPLITSEWAVEVFKVARARGLLTGFVSNGNATAEALDYVRPYADCYKIDLKTMNDRHYRQLGGVLKNVLDSIRMVHERGFWLEVVTLVVPGFSSDEGELRAAAEFLAGVDRNIPWHVTAFHEDYKMWGTGNTTAQMLIRACEIGAAAGLNFVYAGNLPGRVGPWEHTRCPSCSTALIERLGFHILANRLRPDGECPSCRARLPGLFSNPRGTSAPSRGHGWVRPVHV